jgi:Na+-transporting NADH:ubiquinone oxidoreductase subunit D
MLKSLQVITDPLLDKNPVSVHILGICSALAVTTSVATALTLSLALIVVLTVAAGLISLIRHHIQLRSGLSYRSPSSPRW